jgi:predicted nucleotidyltransferase
MDVDTLREIASEHVEIIEEVLQQSDPIVKSSIIKDDVSPSSNTSFSIKQPVPEHLNPSPNPTSGLITQGKNIHEDET